MYNAISIFVLLVLSYKLVMFLAKLYDKPQTIVRVVTLEEDEQVRTEIEYVLDDSDIKYYKRIEDEFNERVRLYFPYYTEIADEGIRFDLDYNDPDAQNVHDSLVQTTLGKQYIENVKKQPKTKASNNRVEIEEYIRGSELSSEDKEICKTALKKIHERKATLTNFGGDTEVDILDNTWEAADKNVKDFLLQQLLDATIRNGREPLGLYCPTGVASRIVNASLVNEPEKMAKTRDLIHQEMMQTAANLRSKLEEKEGYNELDESSQNERLKETIYAKYKDDYIDNGILDQAEVDEMTKDWIEHI